jgi:hydrogenase nickel incorporation protein HypB
LLLNKVDLLPYLDVDLAVFERAVSAVRPGLTPMPVSATRGDGLADWYAWLRTRQGRRDPRGHQDPRGHRDSGGHRDPDGRSAARLAR